VTAAAVAFTFEPETVPRLLGLPFHSTRVLGITALVSVAAYLLPLAAAVGLLCIRELTRLRQRRR
jgi:hypothetical protein